jgi:hypothetical protein
MLTAAGGEKRAMNEETLVEPTIRKIEATRRKHRREQAR